MTAVTDIRQEFAPPHTPGLLRALALALLAHAALVAVLAAGVAWHRELPLTVAEAELWAAVPQEAAPQPQPPQPVEEVLPDQPDTPQPATTQPAAPPAPVVETPRPADIAQEQARRIRTQEAKEQAAAKEQQAQAAREAQARAAEKAQAAAKAEKADQADKLKKAQAAAKEAQAVQAARAAQAAKDKAAAHAQELAKQKAKDKAAQQAAAQAAKAEARQLEEMRQQQLARISGLASAGAGTGGNGNAAKSAGPGKSYQGKVQAAVKPNITYTETIVGNPKTEIEVSLSASGAILSARMSKSSGNPGWDSAALNAIEKTGKLPLDEGKAWTPLTIVISPQTLVGP